MSDFLASMGLQRRAVDQFQDHEANRLRREKDDAFQEVTRSAQTENLGLQRRATQMQLEQTERVAKMQEALRGVFSQGGGALEAAKVAREYGDFDTYSKLTDYAKKAKQEGLTEFVKWMKLGDPKRAAAAYNAAGGDLIDEDAPPVLDKDGTIRVRRKGAEEAWGNLEQHARLLGLGDKVEYKDGMEYVNGQPTGKAAPRNPHDKDRYKALKNPDGSERLVDTHAPGVTGEAPRAGMTKDHVKRLEDLAKDAAPDPGDDAMPEDRANASKTRSDMAGISKQVLEFNADVTGMTPEIAHNIARDIISQRRGPDGKLMAYRATYRAPSGEEWDGIYYQHKNGPRFYKLSEKPVRKAQPTATGLPKIDAKFLKLLRENKDNPEALKEFDERLGIPGAAKRYLEQDASTFGGGDKVTHGDVRKLDQAQ